MQVGLLGLDVETKAHGSGILQGLSQCTPTSEQASMQDSLDRAGAGGQGHRTWCLGPLPDLDLDPFTVFFFFN